VSELHILNLFQFSSEIISFLLNLYQQYTLRQLKLECLKEQKMSDTILVAIMIAAMLGVNLQYLV